MKRIEQIDERVLIRMQIERDFLNKEEPDLLECQRQMNLFPKFLKISEFERDEKTYDSMFWNMNFLSKKFGINLEIAGKDKHLLDAFVNKFRRECYDRKRIYECYRSPNEITHDFGRLNAKLFQIHPLNQLFVTAMSLILDVHYGIECPLQAEGDQSKNLDIGYWYNTVSGVLVPQNICIDNLKPVNGERINFHIHTESARYYKPLRNFIVEKK